MLRRRLISHTTVLHIPYAQVSSGDIYCTDQTFVSRDNYPESGKVAIGVVCNNSNNTIRIISLNTIRAVQYWAFSGYQSYDIPELVNVPNASGNASYFNGYEATELIRPFSYASYQAREYTTLGTSKKDWYLPAGGECLMVFNQKSIISQTLASLSRSLGYFLTLPFEKDASNFWVLYIPDGQFYNNNKWGITWSTHLMTKKTY